MQELCRRLGNPERRFRVIHVVGTNGKSSVAEHCRGLLAARGARAGAYISPHLRHWPERVRLPSGDEPARFAAAVARVAAAVKEIIEELGEDSTPTQFEQSTAAAFLALADDQVEIAAIEAGLGGRLDATNVCKGEVVVLTTVALDHTRWLGETVEEIAAEKLAVLDPGATLVTGHLSKEVALIARQVADAAGARLIEPTADDFAHPLSEIARSSEIGGFQEQNALVARAAVDALLGAKVDPHLGAPTAVDVPGQRLPARAELIPGDPPVMLDLAHNPAAAAALAAEPTLAQGPVLACVALLDDKDLTGFAAALAPALTEVVATETGPLPGSARPGARPHPAARIADAFAQAGVESATAVANPREAVERALGRARELGAIALITGSHYLLAHECIPGRDRSYSG